MDTPPDGAFSDVTGIGMVQADIDGRLVQLNRAFCEITGYEATELLGKPLFEITHPEDRERDRAGFMAFVQGTEATYHVEKRYVRKDGSAIWVQVAANLVRDQVGQPYRTAAIVQEITARRRAEDELRASEQRFHSVLENMSEGLMLFDPNQDLIYQNPASLRIHGFEPGGQGLLSHEEVPVTWKAWDETGRPIGFDEWPVSRVFRGERFQNQVLRVVRVGTGQEFYGSYNGSPIYNSAGKLTLGFITIRDITGQVKAQQALTEHQRRLRAFFESPMMGAIYWNMDGAITDANDRFLEVVGYTRNELLSGKVSWARMTPPEYRLADEHALAELRTTGIDTPYEKEYIRKDGSRVPILIGAAMFDERRHNGVAFVLDISERRRAEQAARESEEQFRTLAESMPNLAWWADPNGSITWYNRRWYEYTGTSSEEMAGWGWQSVHDPAHLPRVLEGWRRALATGDPFEMEFPLRGADGAFRWFLTRVVPVKHSDGTVRRWFGTNTDVSALRDAREVLAQHKEHLESLVAKRTAQLQEVVQELETFSYSVSHDLRTPLRTISGFAEILAAEYTASLPTDAQGHLDRILRACRRMDALITDVLAYSRVSREELSIEGLDLAAVITEVIDANSVVAPRATLRAEGPFPKVRASRIALQQCLANLVTNALKFSRPGVAPVVAIRARSEGGFVRVEVQDNGIGIAAEHVEKVWHMFERLEPSYAGTGVGLAIVRRAVERMGGRVGVESQPGVGSTFWFELPAASNGGV